jgi:hypothetical protein
MAVPANVSLPADPLAAKFPTLGSVFSAALPYVYVFAGLALLVLLIFGGIALMTAAGEAKKTKAAYGRITSALIGFLLIFISYFVVQIVEVILGVTIL